MTPMMRMEEARPLKSRAKQTVYLINLKPSLKKVATLEWFQLAIAASMSGAKLVRQLLNILKIWLSMDTRKDKFSSILMMRIWMTLTRKLLSNPLETRSDWSLTRFQPISSSMLPTLNKQTNVARNLNLCLRIALSKISQIIAKK